MQEGGLFKTTLRESLGNLAAIIEVYRKQGCFLLTEIYPSDHLAAMLHLLEKRIVAIESNSVRHREGQVYAARNVLTLCPEIISLYQSPVLSELLKMLMGPDAGLVRALYFDKPPAQTWSLPWHKDVLIAVQSPAKTSPLYSPVRERLGVPHCRPPLEVLQTMLTIRLHLDEVTEENGPLEVLLQSQHDAEDVVLSGYEHETVYSPMGGLFVMHRLLAHASGKSHPETEKHRRVLHLEFAGSKSLPEGYAWYEFYPL